ncbi:hypothetical protein OUZ56_012114 [Daphnia magna]|uniref:Reverse transcriptase domain-containing protein n=1 Tax=Daphnia magna TaxID=35525 RepID=A0ABQ9Z229_9CRUS|nr:hypothetical protein OUZ56_012114 [Daphnia magna]
MNTQTVFRKGRSTMDKIIGLEHFIRKRFNNRNPTNIVGFLSNVRISNIISEDLKLKVGVQQASPLSPLLFSIMINDFPTLPEPGQKLLFAADIECLTYKKDGREAETK